MDSSCDFYLLDLPNNFQIELKESNGTIRHNKYEDKKYTTKNKIPLIDEDKNSSTGMIIKILKNVKTSQEKVMMEFNPAGIPKCHNQNILYKIKPTTAATTIFQKISENSISNSDLNDNQKFSITPGIKRK